MPPSFRSLLFFLPLLCAPAHAAESTAPAAWLGKPDCRVAPVLPAPADGALAWSGACKDGYAEGKGILEWRVEGKGKRRLEATLVRGEVSGEGTLAYETGKYIGSFRQAMPHGAGYFEYAGDGGRFEGGVVNGLREGAGVHIARDGSTYQGQWKAGKRDGIGKAAFTLGGAYEGAWRDDKFEGRGKIVYAGSGRTWEGEFQRGRAVGAQAAPVGEPERFALKSEFPSVGSNIRPTSAVGFAPPEASWSELTPAQQKVVRDHYPALDDRDEPPYPLQGTRAFLRATAEVYKHFMRYQGEALVYVLVGADGAPKTSSTYGVPDAELGRSLSMAAMMQRFKPARCDGTPCEMIYPVRFHFSAK